MFLISRIQDECNTHGKGNHRHNMRCAERLCVRRLKEFQAIYSTGLTDKRKQLMKTVDNELFSSTVAHITLLINFIVQSSGVEVKDYLDQTLHDRFTVGQYGGP